MFRSSSKLPLWQSATTTTRRRPLVKWGRAIFLCALCILSWRRYSPVLRSNHHEVENVHNIQISTNNQKSFSTSTLKPREIVTDESSSPVVLLNAKEPRTSSDSPESNDAPTTSNIPATLFKVREQEPESVDREAIIIETAPESQSLKEIGTENGRTDELSETVEDRRISVERPPSQNPPAKLHDTPLVRVKEVSEQEALQDKIDDDDDSEKSASHPEQVAEKLQNGVKNEPTLLVLAASQMVIDQPQNLRTKENPDKKIEVNQHSDGSAQFPPYSACVDVKEKAETLPEMVHIPFEESTEDVTLFGWEDAWFSDVEFNITKWGSIPEPKIDFVYTWVNGSQEDFQNTILPYEKNSTLNDEAGQWLESHRVNRYRDWDELRYSIRSVQKYAGAFRNKIQLLVNSIATNEANEHATVERPAVISGKQVPLWLKDDEVTRETVQVLSQEDFFEPTEQGCLPTFNSLTIENQLFNTKSDTDRIFALSDDMLLGKVHAASDIYSPLFGPTMGFKTNAYNTLNPPSDLDARRFGEKPFLIYTSWVLNRRFGARKRKGQVHFGHSISRSVMREAMKSFPRPGLQSSSQKFRGEAGFQLYSWYVTFHYTMERQREALLWSYVMQRSDKDQNGNLGWRERQLIMQDLEDGMKNEAKTTFRKRMFYNMNEALEAAGLEAPKVNVDVQWTSLDGPGVIKDIDCTEFNVNECLAPGFSTSTSDENYPNWAFSTATIFDRLARQQPKCGDCLLKLILNRVEKGFAPLLPHVESQKKAREVVIKALWKYQYVIVDPDAYFVMITDAEQVENVLFKRLIKRKGKVGQLCLNDDVSTEDEDEVKNVQRVMTRLLESMAPDPSPFEREVVGRKNKRTAKETL